LEASLAQARKLTLLEVAGLRVSTPQGDILQGVDLEIGQGEVLGLFGESGCGKSTLGLAIIGLLGSGRFLSAGRVAFEGTEIAAFDLDATASLRGTRIGYIPQDPFGSFDPLRRVGEQMARPLRVHRQMDPRDARRRVLELMAALGVPDPPSTARRFPHELSGGMLQRAVIAAALSCRPALVIADEPTTALDVVVEAQVVEAFTRMVREMEASLLLITHDLGLLARIADRLAAMYAGSIVEEGPTEAVTTTPHHPYVAALVANAISIRSVEGRLPAIEGQPPSLPASFDGCCFAPRCPRADDQCRASIPPLESGYACFHPL
jgi:oligopeptide/dipeptide ABC transporter ATP-binding protein